MLRRALLLGGVLFALPVRAAGPGAGAVNADGGLAVGGHDPVAYFAESRAMAGLAEFSTVHDGATYRFANAANRAAFLAAPARYLPEYGGYCAYGLARGYKAVIDPAAFTIVGGRLFLNYNADIQAQWRRQQSADIARGDANWPKVKSSTKVNR